MHFAARARLVGGIWVAQGEGGGGGRLTLPQQAGAAAQHPPLSIHWTQGGPATSWSVTFHSLCCHLVKKHLHPLHPEHPWPWVSLKTRPGSPAPAKAAPPAWCVCPPGTARVTRRVTWCGETMLSIPPSLPDGV